MFEIAGRTITEIEPDTPNTLRRVKSTNFALTSNTEQETQFKQIESNSFGFLSAARANKFSVTLSIVSQHVSRISDKSIPQILNDAQKKR